jgi:hypothetical protein
MRKLVCAIVFVLGVVQAASACPTAPPVLVAPADNATIAFGNVLLDWNAVAGATGYEVYAGLDGDSPSLIDSVAVTQKSIAVEPGRTVQWKVVAKAPSCTPQVSGYRYFTTTCPTVQPNLREPDRGDIFPVGALITFNWTAVPGAASYDVKVTPDFGATWDIIGENIESLSFTTDDLPEGDWGWEVRANFDGDCEPIYSNPSQFYVSNCAGTPPSLLEPALNASVELPVKFRWSDVDADSYQLYVQRTGGLPRLIGTTQGNELTADDLAAGSYQWWTVARFEGCPDQASAKRPLTIFTTCTTVNPPLIVAPANGATNVGNPVTFQWSSVAGAEKYRVLVSVDGGPITQLTTTETTQTTQTLEGSAIVWAVQALFPGNCPPVTSADSRFTLASTGCPVNPAKAVLVAPAANATGLTSPVLFDWNPVPNATEYRVLAVIGNTDPIVLGTTVDTQLSSRLPSGNGSWVVQTFFGDDCPTTLSERRSFAVGQGASCPTAGPQLLSPANNSGDAGSPVRFQWAPVTDAIGYTLMLSSVEDGDSDGADFLAYGSTPAGVTELERLVPRGILRWFVVAHFAGCPDVPSATFQFGSSFSCIPAALPLLGPADGAEVSSPVTLSWSPGGTDYRVTLETTSGAQVLTRRTTNTSESFRLPAGTFVWRVETLGDCPRVSERRRFTVREAASCTGNAAPALVSPVGTEAQPARVQSPVTLRWAAVPNALAYRVFLARDNQPFEDVAFAVDLDSELELEPGRYRWFVSAIFEGCAPVSSPIAWFEIDRPGCPTAAPTIISPDADQQVSSPVTFLWTEVDRAVKYRVIVLVDGRPVVLGTTSETELSRVLPPGEYVFTIEAEFEECPSTLAPLTRFVVEREQNCAVEAPLLLSPANGATNVATEVDFVWQPVSGAIRYAVIARVGDGAETVLGTTEGTHLVRVVPPGRIHWRVVAFFAGCDPLRSNEFQFVVPRPSNCPDRKPVLLFPRDDGPVPSPVTFEFIPAPRALRHRVWVQRNDEPPTVVATERGAVQLPRGRYVWFVEAETPDGCPPLFSARRELIVIEALPCANPAKPEAWVIGQALSGASYRVRWTPLPNVTRYEVQESASADFANPQTTVVDGLSQPFQHEVTAGPTQFYYRVRGLSACNDAQGPFSDVVNVVVVPARTDNGSAELGEETDVVQTVFLPGTGAPRSFSATTDKPWLRVDPPTGTVPADGLTLNVIADPTVLSVGTNTATVQVQYGSAAGGVGTHGGSSDTIPMSVSLVTPVTPSGTGTPPPDAMIFGAVGHAAGVNNSFFESDIRLTNLTTQTQIYDLHYTPSGENGTQTGSTSTLEIAPGQTAALDDVVATLFGDGTTGSSVGMLEVRPVTPAPGEGGVFGGLVNSAIRQLNTVASSRTYNVTPTGTFGQFVPATLYADFVGRSQILSLQQVAQSTQFRANFGFLEASGNPVELVVRVYDTANTLLATIPVSLQAMQHRQLNGLLQNNGINDLADGRVEVEVVSGEGKVTAYVSEIDNATNDPLLVSPIVKGAVRADRYVVPGMAYINTGAAFWQTDLRIFNSGTTATPATLTFYPMGNPGAAQSREIVLEPGEIEVMDNVLVSLFGVTTTAGGSMVITTPQETSLTPTARTYNRTSSGTYGQYVPGVTVAESIGVADRALQILQVEQSTRFRTNIGVTETTGNPATVEISLITPDQLATPVVTIGLQANEFRQIGLVDFQPASAVYNGRVTVKVISGEGKVTAYGSAIDAITQDPTYVPAQ